MEMKKETVLEWYRNHHNRIDAPCGGNGICGKCKVLFKKEAPVPTKKEIELLTKAELEKNIRLACASEMPKERGRVEPIGDFWKNEKNLIMEEVEEQAKLHLGGKEISYGVAIDVGTTTLVMSMVSLSTGETIATITEWNPQRIYGADVMTRIQFANEGRLNELQTLVKESLTQMFECLLARCNIKNSQIEKVVVVGNTAMLHLLCGFSCEGLARAPFKPVNLAIQKLSASAYANKLSANAVIYILPGISAFVGADIVAGIYACDMDMAEKVGLLVDVGTNGEIVIGSKSGFWVTATSAGPVFESGRVSCGMPAITGAITHMTYQKNKWYYECQGAKTPKGICGSGLLDLLAGMYEHHIIDENGTLDDVYFEDGYMVVENLKIQILQSDIRELQMGKAAIRAGIEILKRKLSPEYMYVAGAFGRGIMPASAVVTGIFGAEDVCHMSAVGNTALVGAKKFLLDENGEARLVSIVAKSREIILSNEPEFEELYICNMQFKNE